MLIRMDAFADHWDDDGLLVRPDIGREMPMWGTVVAVGPGRVTRKGVALPVGVAVGARAAIPWATGTDVTIGGALYRLIDDDAILAVEQT